MAYHLRNRARIVGPKEEVKEDLRSPQEKALSNELILKEIMSHLCLEDLLECRLVNKVWDDVATGVIAPKAPIVQFWSFRTRIPYNYSTNDWKQVGPPDKFMETMRQCRNVPPCRRIFVNGDILKFTSQREILLLPQFFEQVAPFVIYLEIKTESHPLFGRTRPKEGLVYPKLTSLKLVVNVRLTPTKLESNLAAMISILEHAPNLKSVSIEIVGEDAHGAFFRLAERVPWIQIRHFTINREMQDEDFQRILELTGTNLRLKTFEMNVSFYTKTLGLGKNFHAFLERQRGTLESLSLGLQVVAREPYFIYPQLPEMRMLHVNMLMTHQFPALRVVSLCAPGWQSLEWFLQGLDPVAVDSVRTLKLIHQYRMNRSDFGNTQKEIVARVGTIIRKIAKLFPRVRNLTVPANYTVLKAIDREKVWKDVEELRLVCGLHGNAITALADYSDSYSLSASIIQRMGANSILFGKKEREAARKILQFVKQVKVLKFEHSGHGAEDCVTDTVCYWVLLKLENLQCLDLLDHMPHTVSKPAIRNMQQMFRVLQKKP